MLKELGPAGKSGTSSGSCGAVGAAGFLALAGFAFHRDPDSRLVLATFERPLSTRN